MVEGIWRPGSQGELVIGHGTLERGKSFGGSWVPAYGPGIPYRAVDNYLSTLELQAGIIYRRTLTAAETVATVVDLYHWWNDKRWEQHSSHLSVYAPAIVHSGKVRLNLARRKISLAEKWAIQLDGIDTKAERVAEHFGSAWELAIANEQRWAQIRGISKLTAKRIVRDIHAPV